MAGGQTHFTYSGGLADFLPAKFTQGGAPGSKEFDFGAVIHQLKIHNGTASIIYVAWDSQYILDATTPDQLGTGTRKQHGASGVATPGDWPIAAGADFSQFVRARYVYLYLPAAAVVNDTATGAVVLIGARGGVRLDY